MALAWLVLSYKPNWKIIRSIFNDYFSDQLPTARGLTVGALNTMYLHMRLREDEQAALEDLNTPTGSTGNSLSEEICRPKLQELAKKYGIDHVNQLPPNLPCHLTSGYVHKGTRKRKFSLRFDTPIQESVRNFESDAGSTRTDFLPQRPKKQCINSVLGTPAKNYVPDMENALLTPPDSFRKEVALRHRQFKALPRIGFRAFSDTSQGINCPVAGFRARAFTQISREEIPSSPDPDSSEYRKAATCHVSIQHTGPPSPLISITSRFMRCLHIALKKGPKSWIAVIDMTSLGGRVQSAQSLNLQTTHRYVPTGEFLVVCLFPIAEALGCPVS